MERYSSSRIFSKNSQIILLVYDITNKISFEKINYWYELTKEINENAFYVVVGNKDDLFDNRIITSEEGKEYANKIEALFFEISAKDYKCIENIFETIMKEFIIPKIDANNHFILLGDEFVGKTQIINQFIERNFQDKYIKSLTCDKKYKKIKINDNNNKTCLFKFKIFDSIGSEVYRSHNKIFIKKCQIVLFIYDITNRKSFKNLNYWNNLVDDNAQYNNILKCVIGNKTDLNKDENVTTKEGENYAKSINALFFETSAKNNNIEGIFIEIAKKYLEIFNQNIKEKEYEIHYLS